MPKVLFINPAKNYGSTGKIVEQIGLLANSTGWESFLVHSARYDYPSKLNCIKAGSVMSENWHALMSSLFDRQGLHSVEATKHVVKEIVQVKPDIIHLHNVHGYFLNYPLLFRCISELNVPVIWTMHDCWCFTGHCTYFDMVYCERWKAGCGSCPNLSGYPRSYFADRSAKNFLEKKRSFTQLKNLTMVPVSEWLGNLTKQSFLGGYPIQVIHNGVDVSTFCVKENSLRKLLDLTGKFVILGVSSNGFTGRKGMDDFVKLASLLPSGYQIIMIGLTDDELKKIPSSIIGLKRTSSVKELVNYYNLADVFINPTYSDNFPTTNIESLACGTPVITYNTGGSLEAINDKTGVVVDQGDVQALANAIMSLKDYPLSRDDCRKRAESLFDKNKCFEQYIDLYNKLLK